jgi:hypothetical protein
MLASGLGTRNPDFWQESGMIFEKEFLPGPIGYSAIRWRESAGNSNSFFGAASSSGRGRFAALTRPAT